MTLQQVTGLEFAAAFVSEIRTVKPPMRPLSEHSSNMLSFILNSHYYYIIIINQQKEFQLKPQPVMVYSD